MSRARAKRGKDERDTVANCLGRVLHASEYRPHPTGTVASGLHFNETMASDSAADIVRTEALWFEPTSDGMAPLLEDEYYQARAEVTSVDRPEPYPSGM